MSGHSKWHSIKHKKARVDAQRGKLFGRLVREITIAARTGGGSIDTNARLRAAVQTAKDGNLPAEKVERAIKKGTGELPGMVIEEARYEGYAPGGVAVMVEVATDNRNRTSSEIKKIFSKHGGHLGATGCVAWMFQKRGMVTVEQDKADEDTLTELALDSGAEDLKTDGDMFVITSSPDALGAVKGALTGKGIEPAYAQVTMVPSSTVKVEGKMGRQVLKLANALEEHDDVQNIYANFDVPEDMVDEIE